MKGSCHGIIWHTPGKYMRDWAKPQQQQKNLQFPGWVLVSAEYEMAMLPIWLWYAVCVMWCCGESPLQFTLSTGSAMTNKLSPILNTIWVEKLFILKVYQSWTSYVIPHTFKRRTYGFNTMHCHKMTWVDTVPNASKCLDIKILLFQTLLVTSIKHPAASKSGKVPNVTRTNHEQNYCTTVKMPWTQPHHPHFTQNTLLHSSFWR